MYFENERVLGSAFANKGIHNRSVAAEPVQRRADVHDEAGGVVLDQRHSGFGEVGVSWLCHVLGVLHRSDAVGYSQLSGLFGASNHKAHSTMESTCSVNVGMERSM